MISSGFRLLLRVELIEEIAQIYAIHGFETQILAASVRHAKHFVDVALAGAHVATIPYKVFGQLLKHPLTDSGNKKFLQDWATVPNNNIEEQVKTWLSNR